MLKPQFFHSLTTSFYLWLDNTIQKKGETFIEQNGVNLSKYPNGKIANYKTYGSNYQQWVYNSDFGVTLPSVASIDGVEKTRADGVIFDFKHGRVLYPTDATSLTTSFTAKSFNLYSTQDPEEIMIEKAFSSLNLNGTAPEYADPEMYISPAVIIQVTPSENTPSSFGGERKSSTTFRVFVISDNEYMTQGLISIFNDTAQNCFPLVNDFSLVPFNYYGDLKSEFSYNALSSLTNGKVMVDRVYSSGITNLSNGQKKLILAYSEFDVSCYRFV